MRSVDDLRAGVQRALDRLRRHADTDEQLSFHEFELELWKLVLAAGLALVALFLARRGAQPRPVDYEHDGRRYRLTGKWRTTTLGTRFGKVSFSRPQGRRPRALGAAADLPVDRELRLCSGFSLGVVLLVTRFAAQMAFSGARATFAEIHGWAPSSRSTLRMVDAVGAEARAFLESAPAPADDGEILIVQADGGGAPMVSDLEHKRRRQPHRAADGSSVRHRRRARRKERPRKRRLPGKKSKNSKIAVVGVIYTMRKTATGLEGPINKRLCATFGTHEELFQWLRREADKRGYGSKRCIFLGDGSDHLWRMQERYFPNAETCLDWYHVVEKLWIAGECLHTAGSDELARFVAKQKARLRRGQATNVIMSFEQHLAAIPRTGPGNKGRRERLSRVLEHLRQHIHHMRYHILRKDDLDIGTGAVEGAVRNLVRMRLDGPGMRWSLDRAERVLHLRCVLLNGQWNELVEFVARHRIRLAAQPLAARPHTAKAAA